MWNTLSELVHNPPTDLFPGWDHRKRLGQFISNSEEISEMDSGLRRIKRFRSGTDTIETVDYLRKDGGRFVSDIKKSGPNSRRKIALLGPDQEILKTWRAMPDMFAWLLVEVLGREASAIIVDSPIIANSISKLGYISPKSVLAKYFHSNHADSRDEVAFGVLSNRHVESLDRADVFDANIFPSQGLADAAGELIGDKSNFWTIGNIVNTAQGDPKDEDHHKYSGVVVSRIVKEKNIDHAIQAVRLANMNDPQKDPTRLSIFGSGADLARLQEHVDEHGLAEHVLFPGYTDSVYDEFKRASFSILPTRQEAFGLSIVESMACGCIPIVYDVPYGPNEIISDGIDGFLVPYGDIDGIARCVEILRDMDESKLSAMRGAARERAAEFTGPKIAEQWSQTIDAVWNRKTKRGPADLSEHQIELATSFYTGSSVESSRSDESTIGARFTSESRLRKSTVKGARAFMSFRGRDNNLRLRVSGTIRIDRRGLFRPQSTMVANFQVPSELLKRVPPQTIDLFIRINDGESVREFRLPASGIELSEVQLPDGLEAYETKPGYFSFRSNNEQ
ncbi:glycosyltransferase [Brevibacterium sp. FME17]|uniref:glycosyltransferase n=1 Tax=Brevibacterium sp. FME17 TaxID=2742606 RepID=UPI001867FBA0|nr:glycosyltransferase [Brevibacterium sp. FME17]